MNNNDILPLTSSLVYALNPEVLAFHNKVAELQKNCPMVKWEQDMNATVPYCNLYRTLCDGQCTFQMNVCPCDEEGR